MSQEITNITHTVVEDGPGYIDPVIITRNLSDFDSANRVAKSTFERLTSTEREIEPSGNYNDSSGLIVWVVTKDK